MKHTVTSLVFALVFSVMAHAANGKSGDILSNFERLSPQKLLDTANYYQKKNSFDTALTLYTSIINATARDADVEQQKKVVEAYNRSANIYTILSDFRTAYELYFKALLLCEKYDYTLYKPRIYNNIGVIFFDFKEYDIAKSYFLQALDLSHSDHTNRGTFFNNLGAIEMKAGNIDSAFYYLNKSLQISAQNQPDVVNSHHALNLMAFSYQEIKQYDSAFHYFGLALNNAEENNRIDKYAYYLSFVSKLFFELEQVDSALFYVNLSNTIAENHNFLSISAENYLILSQIEDSKKNKAKAFEYFQKHTALKDSIFNTSVLNNINQLRHLHEVSRVNQQVEQLTVEQHIRRKTIRYQYLILIFVSFALTFVIIQNRRLGKAHKKLFEKNVKIIKMQDYTADSHSEQSQKKILSDEMHNELQTRIYTLMEDPSIVCDTEFSLEKLADLVHSNRTYVSQVINDDLKKNFRAFINEYRITEAQRLFSSMDASKYTIETIALKTGFKSRTSFNTAFKEITGVSPGFYLKSMQKQ
jgi:AraC-like DNA-binding protein/tetratricopeptide (TPR) repeat protein